LKSTDRDSVLTVARQLPFAAACLAAQAHAPATQISSPSLSSILRPGKKPILWLIGKKIQQRSLWGGWEAKREGSPARPSYQPKSGKKLLSGLLRRDGRLSYEMTINVALVTGHAVVIGCDSTASVTQPFLNPFTAGLAVDKAGNPKQDRQGRYTVKFKYEQLEEIVTDAWGGVTKMFQLCSDDCHCAAVTAGLATLNERPIALIAEEFQEQERTRRGKKISTVKEAADKFLEFVRKEYDEHYKNSNLPPQFQEGPEFLLGGYGKSERFGSSYRILTKENRVVEDFASGHYGLSWNAQSDAVERVLRGYDRELRQLIEKEVASTLTQHSASVNTAVLQILNGVLGKLNATMPAGVNTALPAIAAISLPWDSVRTSIGYGNLPIQEAVNLVAYLIMMQAGKARFARGVGTVGGFTHIGVITKSGGFKALEEPPLHTDSRGLTMLTNSNRSGSIRATPDDARGAKVLSDRRSGSISDKKPAGSEKIRTGIRQQEIVLIDGTLHLVNKTKSKR
jgi:hypothetical protein